MSKKFIVLEVNGSKQIWINTEELFLSSIEKLNENAIVIFSSELGNVKDQVKLEQIFLETKNVSLGKKSVNVLSLKIDKKEIKISKDLKKHFFYKIRGIN